MRISDWSSDVCSSDLLDYASLVDHIANSYRDPVAAPVRVGVEAKGLELLVMSAVSPRYAGTKILTIRPDNEARGLPTIGGFFVFFDAATVAPLSTMEHRKCVVLATSVSVSVDLGGLASLHIRIKQKIKH